LVRPGSTPLHSVLKTEFDIHVHPASITRRKIKSKLFRVPAETHQVGTISDTQDLTINEEDWAQWQWNSVNQQTSKTRVR
jgi:hypothetical protein